MEGKPEPYRRLDTAVLEALILTGPLGLTEDDISHLHGLDYARTEEEARREGRRRRGRRGVPDVPHPRRARPRRGRRRREHAPEVDLLLSEGADGDGVQSPGGPMALINRSANAVSGALRAVARKRERYTHDVKVGRHTITADEPENQGGQDMGPSPQELLAASLASCTAVTMEMYAERKGWNVDGLEVDCRYSPAERGCPTRFELVMRMPGASERGAGRAPAGDRGQVPGPPHPRGRGRLRRAGRAHLSLRDDLARRAPHARGGAGDGRPRRAHGLRRARAAVLRRRRATARRVHQAPPRPAPPRGRDLVPRRAPRPRRDAASRPRCARPTRRSGCPPSRSTSSARSRPSARS